MNIIKNTTALAHHLIKPYICEPFVALDGTLGKGYDTLELLKMGAKKVYAFDIQKEAIKISKENIYQACKSIDKVSFILDGHENLLNYVDSIDVAIFNLGYLPGGDKSRSTTSNTSLKAIRDVLSILAVDGICVITLYDGHDEGKKEKADILNMAKSLSKSRFHCAYVQMINQENSPPEILVITKKL